GQKILEDQARRHGGRGVLVDQDEASGRAVGPVRIGKEWLAHPKARAGEIVQAELACFGGPAQGLDVDLVKDFLDHRLGLGGRMPDYVSSPGLVGLVRHPAEKSLDV